jgi:Zn-dependent protease with chaperone function
VVLFGFAVVALTLSLYAIAVLIAGYQGSDPRTGELVWTLQWWNPGLILVVVVAIVLIVGGGSLYKVAQLSGGGRVVAEQLGGRLLHSDTTDPRERVLLNVVEEMSIASGTPTPPVYVLDDEAGINAFAAGFAPADAVIGVTRGTLEQLSRPELQGVIAHEFSHILHGDMRLNIRLIGVLHGILILGLLGYFLLRSSMFSGASRGRSSRDQSAMALLALGLGLMVLGFLGSFFGNWIKASVSRQREFLADASAVQFTRDPEGISGALKRIGGFAEGSQVESPNAPEASHMFFGQALRRSLFSTHPALEERISRLDPSFSADSLLRDSGSGPEPETGASGENRFAGFGPTSQQVVDQIGRPTSDHIDYARALMEGLPDEIRAAAHEPYGSRALVYALVISPEESVRSGQLQRLREYADPGVTRMTEKLLPLVRGLRAADRLPVVDICLPALRELSLAQYKVFRENLQILVRSDERIDLFEWTLLRLLMAHLRPNFEGTPRSRNRYSSLSRLQEPCTVVLSTLAAASTSSEESFGRGAELLNFHGLELIPAERCDLAEMDSALLILAEASPALKRKIVRACAECVIADGRITTEEAELLRATADTLGCPMPPLLVGQFGS